MWFIWNKTTFGKNMFAVGSNPEAANVSGVSVFKTTIMVHTLAGAMYGITGFIDSARNSSNTAGTGLNAECDAIAACVIGGVSFVGGTDLPVCRPEPAVHLQGWNHPGSMCNRYEKISGT